MTNGFVRQAEMTSTQLAKRASIISAARRLVSKRGPYEVSVKEISAESGVALGTLYRFFTTKEHLLGAMLLEWGGPLERAASTLSFNSSSSAEERLTRVVHEGTASYQVEPNMLAVLIEISTSRDPFASEMSAILRTRVSRALESVVEEFPYDKRHLFGLVIQACWLDMLISWHTGRQTLSDGLKHIEECIEVLVKGVD